MQEIYKEGYGDSIQDIADAMAMVKQYTNETNPEKIRELAEGAMALQDVFDMDLSESIRGADALMDNMGCLHQRHLIILRRAHKTDWINPEN